LKCYFYDEKRDYYECDDDVKERHIFPDLQLVFDWYNTEVTKLLEAKRISQ
jgi:hypothetical protein